MNTIPLPYRRAITFGLPLLLIVALAGLVHSSYFAFHPKALSLGITVDLLLTVPLVYFFLVRKQNIPTVTTISVFVLGIIVASIILPTEHQFYLSQAKTWVLPVVELSVLSVVVFKVRQMVKQYQAQRETALDFYTAVQQITIRTLPQPAATVLASELAVFYYGFLRWRKRALAQHEFSYHKESGSVALLATVMFLTLVETGVVHLLLERWSSVAAWILSGISLYTAVQIFGIMRSLSQRPIALEAEKLTVRYGFLSEATIPLAAIASVERTTQFITFNQRVRNLSPLGELEPHNVLIRLHSEHTLQMMYGFQRTFTALALHVDEAERFVKVLNDALQNPPLR